MQGDISINNVLMTENPVKGNAFTVPRKFLDDLPLLEDASFGSDVLGLCTKVEQLVAELVISNEYIGFVTYGDPARPWRDCIVGVHPETKSVSCSRVVPRALLTRPTGHTRI